MWLIIALEIGVGYTDNFVDQPGQQSKYRYLTSQEE